MRGEYPLDIACANFPRGSSPHARGVHLLTSTAIIIIHVLELTCQMFYGNIEGLSYLYGKNDKEKTQKILLRVLIQ